MLNLQDILRDLYNSEINIRIDCFWDGGWKLRLGDELNGFGEEFYCDNDAYDMARQIIDAACKKHPDSDFAKNYSIPRISLNDRKV